MSVSLENRCDFVGQRWSEFSFVYEKSGTLTLTLTLIFFLVVGGGGGGG